MPAPHSTRRAIQTTAGLQWTESARHRPSAENITSPKLENIMANRRLTRPFRWFVGWLPAAAMVCTAATNVRADEATPDDFDKLKVQFDQAYQAQDYPQALELAEKMNELIEPQYVETLYNIACLHCLLGHKDQSYQWLEKAVDAGYWDAQHLMRDDDFQSIHSFAERKIVDLARHVLSGTIAIQPYRLGTGSPCGYCEYRAVCRFDWQINDYNDLQGVNKRQMLDLIAQKR